MHYKTMLKKDIEANLHTENEIKNMLADMVRQRKILTYGLRVIREIRAEKERELESLMPVKKEPQP